MIISDLSVLKMESKVRLAAMVFPSFSNIMLLQKESNNSNLGNLLGHLFFRFQKQFSWKEDQLIRISESNLL